MIVRTPAQQKALEKELEGSKFYNFSDTVTIFGTGVFPDMPKNKEYKKVCKLTAEHLVEKKYAKYEALN